MTLKLQMDELISEYDRLLTKSVRLNYLPIIKNIFVPYLLINHGQIDTIAYLFTSVITREDIIEAGVKYIDDTEKVTNVAAINKYLTAVGDLCAKIIFVKYPTTILKSITNFQDMTDEINNRSKKELKPRASFQHLTDDDYKKLIDYLNRNDDVTYNKLLINVVIKLFLLYGFKIGTIADICKDDFNAEKKILKVKSDSNQTFLLELPYSLSLEIARIKKSNSYDSCYLFLTESGQKLSSDYFNDDFISITKKIKSSIKITTTGLAKYAVINMFLEGINPITISQISGMKDANLKYCQQIAFQHIENNTNRYINSKIRAVSTYDDFNF